MELIDLYRNSNMHKKIKLDKDADMINHAYILSSADNLLLDAYASFVVQDICCEDKNSPCMQCLNCQKIMHGNMVDLAVYPRGEKSLVVEDISNIVVDSYIRPMESKYKIYILKNFDLCTVQGQNKLLKTLEEPPRNVIFIMTCGNPDAILPTIRSRAKIVSESALDKSVIQEYLQSRGVTNAATIAGMSDGRITTALALSEKRNACEMVDSVLDILNRLKSSKDILSCSSKILSYKKDIGLFLETMVSVLRDVAIVNYSGINFVDYKVPIQNLSAVYSAEMIDYIVAKITEIFNKMDFNCNVTGLIDQLLLDILEVKFLCQK